MILKNFTVLVIIILIKFRQMKINEMEAKVNEINDQSRENEPDLNAPFTLDEVRKAMAASKSKKAVGVDMMANEIFKNDKVITLLHGLFLLCQRHERIPDIWREAIIHPIPKEGYSTDPLKYRGLALQYCMYKILSHVINDRLVKAFEANDLIADEQNGFRKNHSCTHHLFTLTSLIRNKISERPVYTTFIDFKKAFDYMDRDLLYARLVEYGVTGSLLRLIQQMYANSVNRIRINGQLIPRFNSRNGVKQGDNLSPTLFSAFIDALVIDLNKTNAGLKLDGECGTHFVSALGYTDDIMLFLECPEKLQYLLDLTADWCKKWRVVINTSKTKVMQFKKKAMMRSDHAFHLDGERLDCVESYKYLGVILDSALNMENAIETLALAGSCALSALIGRTRSNFDLGFRSYSNLVRSMIFPILGYAAGAWYTGLVCKKLDQVAHRAMRYFCGLP